jgi:biotin carboxyl carrier protein
MKLQAAIEDKKHDVELECDGRRVAASVDGRKYELEVSETETSVFLIKNEEKIYEISVTPPADRKGTTNVRAEGREYEIQLIDPKRLRSAAANTEHAEGTAEIKTAMPGKVVRILAAAGAGIKKGDGVIVVEAMKMQNELRSPKDGILKEIRFEEGATVNAGDILAVIE